MLFRSPVSGDEPLRGWLDWIERGLGGFPGGAVVKNLSANAGDMGSIPGPRGSHMPWSN